MLRKVFENMLDVTERKSKGAFYTPREIVHYMCQESLIHHLDTAINSGTASYQTIDSDQLSMFSDRDTKKGQAKIEFEHEAATVPYEALERFVKYGHLLLESEAVAWQARQKIEAGEQQSSKYEEVLSETIKTHADQLDKILADIKICDPAIGSGAFSVGLLQEIVTARSVLYQAFLKDKTKSSKYSKSDSDNYTLYNLKRHTIQESIYGVDIDASAIDIARLRLWLSMIVDEEHYEHIEALPNLDYKIVQGNSLVGLPKDYEPRWVDELEPLKEEFFNCTDNKRKSKLRKDINQKLYGYLKNSESTVGNHIDFDFKMFFSEVWHEKGGFDVVIGNPPYIESKKLPKESKNRFKKYNSATGKFDLYVLFLEKGLDIAKTSGSLIFITPTTFMNKQFGKGIREFLSNNYKIKSIIDFADFQVFSKATNYTGIFHIEKKMDKNYYFKVLKYSSPKRKISQKEFEESLNTNIGSDFKEFIKASSNDLGSKNWHFLNNKTKSIIHKIENGSHQLKKYTKNIFVGVQTGRDEVFVVNRDDIENFNLEDELLEPILKGDNIRKYRINWGGSYVIYPYRKDNTIISENTLKKYYPNIYKYLLSNYKKLNGREYFNKSNKKWYELWCERIYSKFNETKIVNSEIAPEPRFAIDYQGFLGNTKIFSTILKEEYSSRYAFFLALLNSEVINFYHIKTSSKRAGGYYDFKTQYISNYPIKEDSLICEPLKKITEYLLTISKYNFNELIENFFRDIANGLVYELYFKDELMKSQKEISTYLSDLRGLEKASNVNDEQEIITSEFERLYDPKHPVRNNLENLNDIEEVRIIKETIKDS
jgi:hypothetical protein